MDGVGEGGAGDFAVRPIRREFHKEVKKKEGRKRRAGRQSKRREGRLGGRWRAMSQQQRIARCKKKIPPLRSDFEATGAKSRILLSISLRCRVTSSHNCRFGAQSRDICPKKKIIGPADINATPRVENCRQSQAVRSKIGRPLLTWKRWVGALKAFSICI